MSKPTYLTALELAERWKGIVSPRTIYSWATHPHRGPKRNAMRPGHVYDLAEIEAFEQTNSRVKLALAKRGAE